jgi:hypothetical protein
VAAALGFVGFHGLNEAELEANDRLDESFYAVVGRTDSD